MKAWKRKKKTLNLHALYIAFPSCSFCRGAAIFQYNCIMELTANPFEQQNGCRFCFVCTCASGNENNFRMWKNNKENRRNVGYISWPVERWGAVTSSSHQTKQNIIMREITRNVNLTFRVEWILQENFSGQQRLDTWKIPVGKTYSTKMAAICIFHRASGPEPCITLLNPIETASKFRGRGLHLLQESEEKCMYLHASSMKVTASSGASNWRPKTRRFHGW